MKEESETDDTDVLRLYIDDDEVKSLIQIVDCLQTMVYLTA